MPFIKFLPNILKLSLPTSDLFCADWSQLFSFDSVIITGVLSGGNEMLSCCSDPYVKGFLFSRNRHNCDSPCFQTKTIKKVLDSGS